VESLTPSIAPPVRPTLPASTESVAPSSAPPATPESVSEERTPTLAKYVPPEYPSEAYARRMEGWIEVSMEITPNGDVLSPRVEDGEKRQLFGRAALVAVRQWKYAPDAARVAGERSRVRLEFRMQE
jgi:protein TonB